MDQILLIIIFVLSGIILVYFSTRRIEFGACLFLLINYLLIPALGSENLYSVLNIGNATIYISDLPVILLFFAFIIRLLAYRIFLNCPPVQRLLLFVFTILVFISMAIGFFKFGFASFVDARRYLVVIAPLLYFGSFTYKEKNLTFIAKAIIITSVLISIIGLGKLLIHADHELSFYEIRTYMSISTNAIIILIAWLILAAGITHNIFKQDIRPKLLLLFFSFMLILLQERTIWVIFGVFLFYFAATYKSKFLKRIIPGATILVMLGGILYVLDLFHFRNLIGTLIQAFVSMAGQDSTFSWRFEGWIVLLRNLPWYNYFLGLPFGSGYERILNGSLVLYNPHNFYVTHILRIGVIGMMMNIISYILLLRESYKNKRFSTNKFTITLMEIIFLSIIANLLGSMTYSLSALGGAIWGIAIAVAYIPKKTVQIVPQKNGQMEFGGSK